MNYLKEAINRLVLVGTAAFALDKHHPKSELSLSEGEEEQINAHAKEPSTSAVYSLSGSVC